MMDNISLVLCSSGTTGLPNTNFQTKLTNCSTIHTEQVCRKECNGRNIVPGLLLHLICCKFMVVI